MTDILSDQQKQYFTNRLTDRMRWARHSDKAESEYDRSPDPTPEQSILLWEVHQAADEEVRDCIREIARACRFDNDLIEPITSAAWTASKEDN